MGRGTRAVCSALTIATALLVLVAGACGGDDPGPSPSASLSPAFSLGEPEPSGSATPDTPLPERPALAAQDTVGSELAAPLWDFGFDVLTRQAAKSGDNVVVSPVSLSAVLAMTLNGARGETEAQMREALRLDELSPQQANQAWADLIAASNETEGAEVRIADSLWLRDGVAFNADFLTANRDYFAADARNLPADLAQAPAEINGWISERTGGRIEDLIDSVPDETVLMLVNTVYAKAGWDLFDASLTRDRPFTLATGASVDVPTMRGAFTATVAAAAKYVAVPAQTDGDLTLWVVVPKGKQTVESVATLLQKQGAEALSANPTAAQVTLELPRFKAEYRSEQLRDDLVAMGMTDAFSAQDADFGGMAKLDALWIDDVLQKAMIDVNEEGVEAAAGSAVAMVGTGMPEKTMTVRADRPFIVVLSGSATQAPLFLAMVRDPR
ncbi:MAG: serpin family protein [Thermoleophilia bacterium]